METDQTWHLRCAVYMPDHMHLVATLGERLSLGPTMQRLKAKTSATLRTAGLALERTFFDRRLRPDDGLLPIFLYIYLNPYRAGLLPREELWRGFYCAPQDWLWFRAQLDEDLPPPECLA